MIQMNVLGLKNITVSVPQVHILEHTPEKVMHEARKRYARQGAERITLVPNRGKGSGWVKIGVGEEV